VSEREQHIAAVVAGDEPIGVFADWLEDRAEAVTISTPALIGESLSSRSVSLAAVVRADSLDDMLGACEVFEWPLSLVAVWAAAVEPCPPDRRTFDDRYICQRGHRLCPRSVAKGLRWLAERDKWPLHDGKCWRWFAADVGDGPPDALPDPIWRQSLFVSENATGERVRGPYYPTFNAAILRAAIGATIRGQEE